MFLTSLAAFQMMNVNPCISTVSVAAAEEREEIRSWKAKVCFFLPLRYRSWGKSKVLLLYLSPASWGFPAFSERCSGVRCSRFPSCWWKEEKKPPNSWTLLALVPSGCWWQLCAGLCAAFHTSVWELLVQAAGKAPRNSQINFSSAEKTVQKVKNTSTQILAPVFKRKGGFSCYTEPLTHVLQWRKVEHSSCHLSFPLWSFVPAADVEETSQLWGSFPVNIDLWQEKMMDFR